MQQAAIKAGLGRVVWVDPRPATPALGYYLANYLTKDDSLKGARRWANIGTYDGIGGRDIVMDSPRIQFIKARAMMYRTVYGKHPLVAYRLAVHDADQPQPLGETPY